MKKWIIGIVLAIIIMIPIAYFTNIFDIFNKDDGTLDDYDKNIIILNENISTDIILYGEMIPFRSELEFREVHNISSNTLNTTADYQILILSDLNGGMSITNEELLIIKEKVFENQLDFYYLGTKELSRLQEMGFFTTDRQETELCLAIVYSENELMYYNGIWTSSDVQATNDDRATLGMLLVRQFIRVLKTNQ
jgi:hypothetical protein